MKIQKFNEGGTSNILKVKFKIFASVEEDKEPTEYSGTYDTYNKALKTILGWIDSGVRDNKKLYDAYIVKITSEKINNDEIKARISANKYNL